MLSNLVTILRVISSKVASRWRNKNNSLGGPKYDERPRPLGRQHSITITEIGEKTYTQTAPRGRFERILTPFEQILIIESESLVDLTV